MPKGTDEIVAVPTGKLVAGDSPRLDGIDEEHARLLAEFRGELPPILVDEATMGVIDGMHRLRAAELNGAEVVPVRFFRGSAAEAFRLAVKLNLTHGLPLTIADRRRAVCRIIRAEPRISDRAVAALVGLAASTVAAIRSGAGAGAGSGNRIGRDGRTRPLTTAEGRRIAGEVIARHPQASLREIARKAGISLGTAHDVRTRVLAGRDPVPSSQANRRQGTRSGSHPARTVPTESEINALLDGLRRDPSLRYSESGRVFLHFLGSQIVNPHQLTDATRGLPPHCAIVVAKIARQCAQSWLVMADELDRMSAHGVQPLESSGRTPPPA